ncbi:YbdD/YjiX family protein, partial [Aliarcobacter butzleri]
GLSSYEKYLEHMKRVHPDKEVLSRGDFFKECIERKYNSGGINKCC